MADQRKGIHTTAVHAGFDPAEHKGAVSVPIYQSSTFAFPSAEEGADRFAGLSSGPIYTRLGNPTVEALERCVAELEGGCGAVGTATGMAAVSTVLLALLRQGDHVVATHPLYGPTSSLLEQRLASFGVATTFVAAEDAAALAGAVRPETRLILTETPANPTLALVDLESAAAVAREAGVPLVVDNTFAGPYLQRPLEQGAEIVLHSMTKSLNGHADVVAGVVVARRPGLLAACRDAARHYGLTMDPHQAWLVLRGIRTLGMRVERAQAERDGARGLARAAPGDRLGALPGAAVAPAVRARAAADVGSGVGPRLRAARRRRGRTAADELGPPDHARGLAGRRRVADRAPRLDDPQGRARGGAAPPGDHPRPGAPGGRLRGPRRPARRPRRGAGARRGRRARAHPR